MYEFIFIVHPMSCVPISLVPSPDPVSKSLSAEYYWWDLNFHLSHLFFMVFYVLNPRCLEHVKFYMSLDLNSLSFSPGDRCHPSKKCSGFQDPRLTHTNPRDIARWEVFTRTSCMTWFHLLKSKSSHRIRHVFDKTIEQVGFLQKVKESIFST